MLVNSYCERPCSIVSLVWLLSSYSAHFSWWWLRWLTSSPSLISAAESGIRMSDFSPGLSSSTSRCHLRYTRPLNYAAKSAVQMRESANAFTKECFEKMFEHFISIVKTRYLTSKIHLQYSTVTIQFIL